MSTTADPILDPRPPELAPSGVAAEEPSFARVVGFAGLFALVLGTAAVLANRVATTPRAIGEGWGFILAAAGVALMLYHAVRDGDSEVRRLYGGLGAGWLVLAVLAALVPGPVFKNTAATTEMGYNLPWAVGFGLVALLFLVTFVRHETDEAVREYVRWALLGVGALLAVGTVLAGFTRPDFLAGPGLALALLGLGYLCGYLGSVDTTDGLGYRVAFALGLFGAGVAYLALARTAFPPVLSDGPAALRKPTGPLDTWKVLFRLLAAVVFLVPVAVAAARKSPGWLAAALGLGGLIGAGVLLVGSFTTPLTVPYGPFLVPRGVILGGLGLVYLAVSLGACSDSVFVTLTRRELGSYFVSPIGYIGLFGMALFAGIGYGLFLGGLSGSQGPVPEPIVGRYFFAALTSVFVVLFLVPALTMRLFAEEARTGSLEVLLTAPVGEATVVLSKFVAVWLFYLAAWLPFGLYLVALRVEGGEPFDYRPLLSFYVALAASGAAFLSMGLFFSSLTKNQIVAAVLTFGGMLLLLLTLLVGQVPFLGASLKATLARLSFYDLWEQSLGGQLPVRDVLLQLSLAVFWLFLTVKVLESRRWR